LNAFSNPENIVAFTSGKEISVCAETVEQINGFAEFLASFGGPFLARYFNPLDIYPHNVSTKQACVSKFSKILKKL